MPIDRDERTARRKTAKKTSRRQADPRLSSRDNRPGIIRFFADRRTHYAIGAIFIIASLVMLLVLFSFLKNGAADHSMAAWQSVGQIADSGQAHNAGGAVGVKISHILLTEGLGVGSFVLVVYLAVLGLKLLRLIKLRFWPFTFRCLFLAISLSIIFGLLTLNSESFFHWGGRHGREVNLWLEHMGSFMLSYAVSIALAVCIICIYLNQLTYAIAQVRRRMPTRKPKEKKLSKEESRRMEFEADESARIHNGFDDENIDEQVETISANAPVAYTGLDDNPAGDDGLLYGEVSDTPGFSDSADRIEGSDRADISDRSDQFEEDATDATGATGATDVATAATVPAAVAGGSVEASAVPLNIVTPGAKGLIPENLAEPSHQPVVSGGDSEFFDPRAELSHFRFPTLDLLDDRDPGYTVSEDEIEDNKNMLVNALAEYKIGVDSVTATVGPSVTLYEIIPSKGVFISQVKSREDDLARSLAAIGIRIIAPIPGKGTIGIEVPNRHPRTVSIKEVLGSKKFRDTNMELPIALGRGIDNEVYIQDLVDLPHLLVAGATGQGKSVGLNCILASLLYAKHPSELKIVLVDPKKVEFSLYGKLRKHYLACREDAMDDPIITDPEEATLTLKSLCTEMDNRYELMKRAAVNKVQHYNRKIKNRQLAPVDGHRYLPYILVVVDEYADLVMMGAKEISMFIARLAQKGRAAGIHVIIATQRPSTDVITGMIKANFPSRMAFRVMQAVDSKTILDRVGANQLIGRGDMLFRKNGPTDRVQCAFIDTDEIERITEFVETQTGCPSMYILPEAPDENKSDIGGSLSGGIDSKLPECARFIVTQPNASTSMLQRRFGIGYNKAGKIMDQMEAMGIVGPAQGQRPRAVLTDPQTLEQKLADYGL